jgi:Calpain family cysteine protease
MENTAAPASAATVEYPYRGADPSKFKLKELCTSGGFSYAKMGRKEQVAKPIEDGKAMFMANPSKYIAMTYQADMVSWPPDKQKFTLYHREGTEKFAPRIDPNGWMTVLLLECEHLPPLKDDIPKSADTTTKTATTSLAAAAKKPNAKEAPTKKTATAAKPESAAASKPRPAAPAGAATVEDPYRGVDPSKFKLKELCTSGGFSYAKVGQKEQVMKPIEDGKAMFMANPSKYIAMAYKTDIVSWPPDRQQFTLYHREGTEKLAPRIDPNGWMTVLLLVYEHLPPFKEDVLPTKNRDKYTDAMVHKGRKIHDNKNFKPLLPGRGMGCCDTPLCKIIGDVDPSDIHQGQVGDCWLLSAISALAEFDGAVKKLFRKTKNLDKMPLPGPNQYIVTLTDLATWKEVDIIIDERLAVAPDGSGLLASKPSEDGELWVCYLEKAISIHCGGWDNITGGQSTHAWAIMTGCKEQYTIKKRSNGKYACHARFHPKTNQWALHHNSPKEGNVGVYQVAWPQVGGGGSAEVECTQDELFMKMYAFDQENYIVAAGTTGGNNKKKTDRGLVDNHAYTVIEAVHNAAGTGIDLFKVRNPWGTGEIEDGDFDDDGPGWDKYPQIKKLLKPVVADDGIFW